MIASRRPSSTYYRDRALRVPTREYWPKSPAELVDLSRELRSPTTFIGAGEHINHINADTAVIRTTRLDQLHHLDPISATVDIGPGLTWGALQEALLADGFVLSRYRLYPSQATLGGLLSTPFCLPPHLHSGDLRTGLLALSGFDPSLPARASENAEGHYHYLSAPRKASGPDLRYHFVGARGQHGPILRLGLAVDRLLDLTLLLIDNLSLPDLGLLFNHLLRRGLFLQALHFDGDRQRLQLFLPGPPPLLKARRSLIEAFLRQHLPAASLQTRDRAQALTRRSWLERRHPNRRSHFASHHHGHYLFPFSALLQSRAQPLFLPESPPRSLEITAISPQTVEIFARFDGPAPAPSAPAYAFWTHRPSTLRTPS